MSEIPEAMKPIFAEAERQLYAISKNVGGFKTAEEALYHITEIALELCTIFFKQWGGRSPNSGGKELDGRQWVEFPQPVVRPQ